MGSLFGWLVGLFASRMARLQVTLCGQFCVMPFFVFDLFSFSCVLFCLCVWLLYCLVCF